MKSKDKKVSKLFLKSKSLVILLLILLSFSAGYFLQKIPDLKKSASLNSFRVPAVKEFKQGDFEVGEVTAVDESEHIKGNIDARITLVVYTDTEGPFDKNYYQTLKQVVKENSITVSWVYRHFPIDDLHPNARKQAEGLECATKLKGNDGFWSLVDKIFTEKPDNNALDNDKLSDLAESSVIDKDEFKKCLDSSEFKQKVEDDYQSGIKANITGTPQTILLDSKTNEKKFLPGNIELEQLRKIIKEQLTK